MPTAPDACRKFVVPRLQAPVGMPSLTRSRSSERSPTVESFRSAAVMTTLDQNDIRSLTIPIPLLAEQRRIVAELDALQAEVDALKRLQAETADQLDAVLPSILDKAFKGEL